MSDPFVGEIRMASWGFAAKGWALCNGQIMSIAQNQALFSLLGTMYGGNGTTTFALPDLRGRTPISVGQNPQGALAGEEAHTLTLNEMPMHSHGVYGSQAAADPVFADDKVRFFGQLVAFVAADTWENARAAAELDALRQFWGIREQHLERLLHPTP